jgi:hypothetical protein
MGRSLVAVVALSAVLVVTSDAVSAATTTTVVDIPLARGATQRIVYLRPDNPIANLVAVPGGDGYFGFDDKGNITTDAACMPFWRTRDAFVARGIAVAFVDQTSDHFMYQFADIREVARYMRSHDNVPIWITGGSNSTQTTIDFAAMYPPEGPLGFVSFSPVVFDPEKAALVRQPTLVIVDRGDAVADGGSLNAALTGTTVKELIALGGGSNAGCGYHLFNGVEAQFVASVAGFIDRHNAETGPVLTPSYQGLWWNSPANSESGWGVNLAHQGDTIFASWFTYDTAGKGWWLVVTLHKSGDNAYTGDLYTVSGARFDEFNPANVTATKTGTATFTFTDANNGTFNYVIGAVNQTKYITREVFGTMPTCTFGAVADLTTATNYQDLWWNKPANSESGWGINLNHQGDTIFATWFTYDIDGTPLWLVVTANKTGPGVYSGDLYRTSGPRYDAFNPGSVTATKVGTATFTFADGNDATFDYTVQLAGLGAPVHQQKQITREIFTAPGTTCQ